MWAVVSGKQMPGPFPKGKGRRVKGSWEIPQAHKQGVSLSSYSDPCVRGTKNTLVPCTQRRVSIPSIELRGACCSRPGTASSLRLCLVVPSS